MRSSKHCSTTFGKGRGTRYSPAPLFELPEHHQVKIWVDADACPVVAKEILFRAADRTGVQLTLVANQPLSIDDNTLVSCDNTHDDAR